MSGGGYSASNVVDAIADDKIFVMPVESVYRIRISATGTDAV